MTSRSPALMGLLALAFSIYGLAQGGLGVPGQAQQAQGDAAPVQGLAARAPFNCSLVVRSQAGGTSLEGRIQAREAITASYALRVRGPGVAIDQGGEMTLASGESTTLGQASVSGAASTLDATLTLTVNGQTYSCPLQRS